MSEISQTEASVSAANEQPKATLLLIDGHAMFHRAFHAFPENMSTQTGEPTNAVFGFAQMLLAALKNIHPDYAAVTFDRSTPTFRHLEFPTYKAQRPPLPDTMRPQYGRIRQLVEAFGMPIYELDGFEADDVMGTLSCQATDLGLATVIVTGDLDTLQLVNPSVRVTYASKPARGELAYYDEATVQARYGFAPPRLVDYKALVGDKSDNIPGVPGIGDKTATNLINQYGTLEGILEHLDGLPPKVRVTLREHEALARQCKHLATIVTNVPVTLDLQAAQAKSPNRDEVLSFFREMEFYSIVDRVARWNGGKTSTSVSVGAAASSAPKTAARAGLVAPAAAAAGTGALEMAAIGPEQLSLFAQGEVETAAEQGSDLPAPEAPRILTPAEVEPAHTNTMVIDSEDGLAILARSLRAAGAFALDLETTSEDVLSAGIVGLSLSMGKSEAYYLPVGHVTTPDGQEPGRQLSLDRVLEVLKPLLEDESLKKYGHNIKFDMLALVQHGVWVRGVVMDSMVGAYLLNPGRRGLGLKDQAFEHLGIIMTPITDLIGTGSKQITMAQTPIRAAADYAGADADMTYRLAGVVEERLKERHLYKLFSEVEMPLIPVLARMELAGILVDAPFLRRMATELDEQIKALEKSIYEAVGHQFNINSPKQLGDILFGELKLPPIKKTKSGYSVDAEVLDTLKGSHPAIDNLLEFRQLGKLKSTYVDGLLQLIHPKDGRVHTNFNQTIASTGRLSSSQPNLQNIPIRTEVGRRIRRAFLADPGCVLLTADYSQVELRILAHITHEPALVAAFARNEDVHAATAARLYKIPLDEVTPAMRRLAKTINFGVLYGQSAFGLARVADISQSEAAEYIHNYEATFPLVKAYVDGTKAFARSEGYVETLLGRRRYMPDLLSLPMVQRQAAEREAINMPIQGTNADIIKIAMVRLQDHFEELGLRTRMILQVHDELVFETPEDELELVKGIVRATMEEAMTLSVPLKVDMKIGPNWYEVEHTD
jgi:DNA polymerase-1